MTDYATQLWSQLCLDASLTVNDPNLLYVSLSSRSSSNADIRAPSWTPSTCIEKIGLSFHFSTCRRTRNALRAPVTVSESGTQLTFPLTEPIDDHLGRCYHSPLSLLGGSQDTLMERRTPLSFPTSSVGASPVNSQGSVLSNSHSTSSLDAPTILRTYATQEVNIEILVQMVDSSLRRMMSDNKPVRSGGIVLSSDAGCPKLAAISPALFSPGYIKVQPIIKFHDSADCLTPGGFTAYCSIAHGSAHCVPSISPHEFRRPKTQTQAITRSIDQQL